jgi:hypothetical protein
MGRWCKGPPALASDAFLFRSESVLVAGKLVGTIQLQRHGERSLRDLECDRNSTANPAPILICEKSCAAGRKLLKEGDEARPVWLGSATFDRDVGFSRYTGQVTHHIAPDIEPSVMH